MTKEYNKLVRDKIPGIIINNHQKPITRILNNIEYKQALENKLQEEVSEVLLATGSDRIEELADVLEIIRALAKLENTDLQDIINTANIKSDQRGSFDKKIFLEKVISEDNK